MTSCCRGTRRAGASRGRNPARATPIRRRMPRPLPVRGAEMVLGRSAPRADAAAPADAVAARAEPSVRSPLGADDGARFVRGRLIHRLLQTLPELAARSARRRRGAVPGAADPRARRGAAGAARARGARGSRSQGFRAAVRSWRRCRGSVVGRLGDHVIAGQIDRLVVTDTTVFVLDYKTQRPVPASPAGCAARLSQADGGLSPGAGGDLSRSRDTLLPGVDRRPEPDGAAGRAARSPYRGMIDRGRAVERAAPVRRHSKKLPIWQRMPQLPLLPLLEPLPLLPLAPDAATAGESSEVDSSSEIAGGVTTANLPQLFKKLRRARSASLGHLADLPRQSWSSDPLSVPVPGSSAAPTLTVSQTATAGRTAI